MSIFKKEHTLVTSFEDSRYLEEFFKAYEISTDPKITQDGIVYKLKMYEQQFNALCDYVEELKLMGVYPIRL